MMKNSFIIFLISIFVFACKKEHEVNPVKTEVKNTGQICGQTISDQFIVLYKDDSLKEFRMAGISGFEERARLMETRSRNTLKKHGVDHRSLRHVYHTGIGGFSARMDKAIADELRKDPAIQLVEQDKILTLSVPDLTIQAASAQLLPWGVQRVGYGSGIGKTVWIIDTGVDLSHPDLNVDVPNSKSFVECKSSAQDDNGHGTHVAGIIGAKDNEIGIVGVAAGANLRALKALDSNGSGAVSDIILALQWALSHGKQGDVINMSLGGDQISASLDKLVYQISMNGIYVAIAAGNESSNADTTSPARVNSPNVFTVSAMDSNDRWASFSNFGSSVDVCSPGVDILSTYINGKYAKMSGTSMACPHVAGLLLLNGGNLNYSGYVIGDPDGKPDPIAHK